MSDLELGFHCYPPLIVDMYRYIDQVLIADQDPGHHLGR